MIARLTRPVIRTLTSPIAGPVASFLALALAAGLAVNASEAHRREAALKAQVAALSDRTEQQGVYWKAQLSACRAEAAIPAPPQGAITRVAGDDAMAAQLASQGPAGFDVCARMEAADQAVLASLHAGK